MLWLHLDCMLIAPTMVHADASPSPDMLGLRRIIDCDGDCDCYCSSILVHLAFLAMIVWRSWEQRQQQLVLSLCNWRRRERIEKAKGQRRADTAAPINVILSSDWSNVSIGSARTSDFFLGCTCNQDLILSFAGLTPLDTRAVPSTQSSTWTYISTHLSPASRLRSPASVGLKKSPVVI